jgi:hypothetical protein
MSFVSGYIIFSQMSQWNGRNGALHANFLAIKNLKI